MKTKDNIPKKTRSKKWIAFMILIFSVFASLFIIGKYSNNSAIGSQDQKSEFASEIYKKLDGSKINPTTGSQAVLKSSGENLSEKVSSAIVQDIITKNQKNLISGDKKILSIPPDDKIIDKALEEGLSTSLEFPTFSKNDIRISSNDSTEAQINYLAQLVSTFNKYFSSINVPLEKTVGDFLIDKNATLLNEYINITPKYIADLLAISSPPSLSELHLKNLNLWQKRLAVLIAISKFNDDPLKTMVALQYLDEINKESYTLEIELGEHLKKLSR